MPLVPVFVLFFMATFVLQANEVIWPPPLLPAGTPIAEFPVANISQARYFLEHIHQARSHPVDLVFDGDSITDFWQAGGDHGQALFQKLYGPRNVIDYAIAGDRTEHVLWRLQHGELDTLHPKLAMLMIGTNNLGGTPPQEIADGITKIVQTYRTQCPDMHVLLLGIFPRAHLPTDSARAQIKEINAIISKLDDGQHITYLDIGDKFLQPDGTLTADIMPDFLHPSAKGYQIWADAVQPMIDKYCPLAEATPTAGFVAPTVPQIDATLPTLGWPFPMSPPPGTPSTLFSIPHADWFLQFQGNLDKLKQGPYDLVFDGDGITERWQNVGEKVFQERYGNFKTLDIALVADLVQNVLWRVQHGDLEGQDPKLIMLMIGSGNDFQEPQDIASGIKMIVGEYETRCPHAHILLLGVFPKDELPTSGSRPWIKKINAILSTFASDSRVTYLDFGDKFLAPDGTTPTDLLGDHLVPTEKGYQVWADAIQPVIDQYLPAK